MKSKLQIFLFIQFLLITGSFVFAEESILNLHDAISISLKNNNRYKIAIEKEHEKDLKIREVWGELWPELSSGTSVTRWGGDNPQYAGSDGKLNIQIIKVSIAINPGNFYNKLKSTWEDYLISVNEERKIKAETIVNTIKLFYSVILARETVELRSDSVKALEENLHTVETGYKTGSYTRLAYLRAKVAVANETTRLINARKDYEKAKAALNIHLGRDIENAVNLDNGMLELNGPEDTKLISMTESDWMDKFREFVSISFQHRPELIQINHLKEFYKYKQEENDSVYLWPTFFVNGSYDRSKLINPLGNIQTPYGNPTDFIINMFNEEINPRGWKEGWTFTVGATYRWGTLSPADSSGQRSKELKSLSSQVDMELDDFTKNIKLEIQNHILSMVAASHAIIAQRENVKTAEEAFHIAVIQFSNGVIDNTELLNANVELSSAKTMYIQALYDFQTTKAMFNRALGIDYFTF